MQTSARIIQWYFIVLFTHVAYLARRTREGLHRKARASRTTKYTPYTCCFFSGGRCRQVTLSLFSEEEQEVCSGAAVNIIVAAAVASVSSGSISLVLIWLGLGYGRMRTLKSRCVTSIYHHRCTYVCAYIGGGEDARP